MTMLVSADMIDPQAALTLVGQGRNIKMSQTAAGASATWTAEQLVVSTAASINYRTGTFSKTLNLATTGAGGMDTGAAPVSGFVSVYAIFNPLTATVALLAQSGGSGGPVYAGANMPAGFTASALIAIVPTNPSGQIPICFQLDRKVYFLLSTAVNNSGSVPITLTAVALPAVIPVGARTISGVAGGGNGTTNCVMALASDANGIAKRNVHIPAVATGMDGLACAAPFEDLPLITPQTFFYKALTASTPVNIFINAYTF